MRRKLTSIFFVLLLSFGLAGCWDARELTDISIAVGLGIDKEDDLFQVTVQLIDPAEIAGKMLSSRSASTVYTTTGHTIFEAMRKLTTLAPREIYLGHLRIVIFGEEYAKEGILDALDFMSRYHEMRTDFYISIARENKASDLLKIITPLEKSPANKIFSSLEASHEFWAPTKGVKLDELIASMSSEGKEAVLTGLYVQGDPEQGTNMANVEKAASPADIKVDYIGVFNGEKLVGWLNKEESKGVNYLENEIKNSMKWVNCEKEGRVSLELIDSKTDVKGSLQGNKPKITINVETEANIAEVQCTTDLSKPETITAFEKKAASKQESILNTSIERAKELEADIFGFGEVMTRSDLTYWKEIKKNWNQIFANELEVEVKAKVNIRRTGTINESFFDDVKKKSEMSE
ncbi:spore germination protein KC [Salirhabdus euzebyi]|uniref:Spore germination protein KC n=1 Tax=Salirhabdus euzebyi TaxID=394506 RepID=A0A841Q3Z5_9BACI|nr:Ger(x)C family spore germination protein [Salirhabdus euzebyi]MBB6453105.1 spore germination protein KC [Salirhabdus euzebyi]